MDSDSPTYVGRCSTGVQNPPKGAQQGFRTPHRCSAGVETPTVMLGTHASRNGHDPC